MIGRMHPAGLALTLASSGAVAQGVPAPMPVTVRANWAEPAAYEGPCPVTIRFSAALQGTWGEVTYRWIRSDGVETPPEQFTFDNPSHGMVDRVVEMDWEITAADAGDVWAAVTIVRDMYRTPQRSSATPARATVACTSAAPAPNDDHLCAFDDHIGAVTSRVRACARQRYEETAAILDTLVTSVRGQFDHDHETRRRSFEDAQTAWLAYRAAACAAAYHEIFPGSFAAVHRYDCLERLTRERIAELKRTYLPEQ